MQWKEELTAIWGRWDTLIERARTHGRKRLPALSFPKPRYKWIEKPARWASMHRGLGDYARFALAHYLKFPEHVENPPSDLMVKLTRDEWSKLFPDYASADAVINDTSERYFEYQLRDTGDPSEMDRREWRMQQRIFDDPRLWTALANAANISIGAPGRARPIDAGTLQNRRFAGKRAIPDCLEYLRTGVVPLRQAPFPDEISDLGIFTHDKFRRKVPFYRSRERSQAIDAIARHLTSRDPLDPLVSDRTRVTCLWSSLEPHGLIATCKRVIKRYWLICNKENCRRLPIIYVPVGLDAQKRAVSRRGIVRDLHTKLCVRRAQLRGEKSFARIAKNASGEEIDAAIGEIRRELSRSPALLVFGVHHHPPDHRLRAIDEELLDAPLPYLIDRLMVETGPLNHLVAPQDSHASHILLLSDGRVNRIANLPVRSFALVPCPTQAISALMRWTGTERLVDYLGLTPQFMRNRISTNETELAVIDSAFSFCESRSDTRESRSLRDAMSDAVFGSEPIPSGPARVELLVCAYLDHLLAEAQKNVDASWFCTILHITSLPPGGVRLFTAARVLSAYVVATAAREAADRPSWAEGKEQPLWSFPSDSLTLPTPDVDAFNHVIQYQLKQFERRAGNLIRRLSSANSPGFDGYAHPYESPDTYSRVYEFEKSSQLLEIRSPFVRRVVNHTMGRLRPEKNALLNRLLAEEFIRRVAIVQCHQAQRDILSLVDKRYIVLAVFLGLNSLKFPMQMLLSAPGAHRAAWLISPSSPRGVYYWIFQCLYQQQLNGTRQELSEQHGAEFLKRDLLKLFLRIDPDRKSFLPDSIDSHLLTDEALAHLRVKSHLVQELIAVSLRTSNPTLGRVAFRAIESLMQYAKQAVQASSPQTPEPRRSAWQQEIERIEQQTITLRLDAAIDYETAFNFSARKSGRAQRDEIFDEALRAIGGCSAEGSAASIEEQIRCLLRNRLVDGSPMDPFATADIERLQKSVPTKLQRLYDYLLRYAENVAGIAEKHRNSRARRRMLALSVFELADAMRTCGQTWSDQPRMEISPSSLSNAARVCLALGNHTGTNSYYERAYYYWFQIVQHGQAQIDRISCLLIQAAAIRLRAESRLALAMRFLKTAEAALIHYPSELNHWYRYYLDRANLFRARALLARSDWQRSRCVFYCKSDISSLKRLAPPASLWVARADEVLKDLPETGTYSLSERSHHTPAYSQSELDGHVLSSWREKAIETWPAERAFLEDPKTTTYELLRKLLSRLEQAHRENDRVNLQRTYSYAHWCLYSSSPDLKIAAGTVFFEALVKGEQTLRAIPRWVEPDAFEEIKARYEAQIGPESYAELCDRYEHWSPRARKG